MQLPPTVRSTEALRRGLGMSLFERLMRVLDDSATEQLVCQFRMHKHIMSWSNAVFYKESLIAAECVENRLLCDSYPNIPADAAAPVLWIDTAGIPWLREDEEEAERLSAASGLNRSRSNRAEAALVVKYLQELVANFGVAPADIGVITPYAAQAKLIRRFLLHSETQGGSELLGNVTVQTVDGFQGREREVIIISLVRSNHRKEIGFLADARRLNVAVTRARSHLVIIGDSETVTEGSCAKYEALNSSNADTNPAAESQQIQLAGTPTETEQTRQPMLDELDTRKALAALFELASSCGDLRLPYEYLNSSDVPAVDGHRPSAREDKKECSTVGERRTKVAQPTSGSRMPAKTETKVPQNRQKASTTPADAACNAPPTQDDDTFATATRETLEALLCRIDTAKRKRGGHIDELPRDFLVHTFPPSLTSYQRLVVHQLAEELHLDHVSKGEGAGRFIEVGFNLQRTQKPCAPEPARTVEASADSQTQSHERQHTDTPARGAQTLSQEPQGSLPTPEHSREKGSAQGQAPANEKPLAAGKRRDNRSKKLPSAASATGDDDSEDIDALLEQHRLENKKCGFAGCKDSTELMGRMCPYCRSRFCIKHALPEIHGCGEAAATQAKQAFRKQWRDNIRVMTYAKDGTVGTRLATIAGTAFVNPSVGSNSQNRDILKNNLRKNIEGKTRERASQRETKKKG